MGCDVSLFGPSNLEVSHQVLQLARQWHRNCNVCIAGLEPGLLVPRQIKLDWAIEYQNKVGLLPAVSEHLMMPRSRR